MKCHNCGFREFPEEANFCPECGSEVSPPTKETTDINDPVEEQALFLDFQVRAWMIDQRHAQVMVHSSPVGDMRRPVTVPVDLNQLTSLKEAASNLSQGEVGSRKTAIDIGLNLSHVLLPTKILSLLIRGLEHIEPPNGLRIRLCLDDALIDLPWEFLYRPDEIDQGTLAGFLVLDPRVSIVREAPISTKTIKTSGSKQRLLFVGALGSGNEDPFGVKDEYNLLLNSLNPLKDFLDVKEFLPASGGNIERFLRSHVSIFHYAGHVNVGETNVGLLREIHETPSQSYMGSEQLAPLLWKAETRMAFFNACNSGDWKFIKPLLRRSGLATVIGVQGSVEVCASQAFARKLYSHLAVGLSFDEAVTAARLHLLEPGLTSVKECCAWGSYMVYMPSAAATIFPRPQEKSVIQQQNVFRKERSQIINNITTVIQNIGTIQNGGKATGIENHKREEK